VWGTADKIWETVLTSQRPASLATMTTELNDAVVLVTDHMTSRLQVTSELRVGSVAAVLEPAHAWIETAVSSGEPMCNTLIPDTGNDMVAPCCDAESVCPGRSTVMPDEMIKSVQLDVATLRAAVTQVDVELRWLQNAPRRVELAHDETAAACRAQAEAAKELSHRPRTITQPDTRLAETKGSTEPVNVTSAVRRDVGLQTVIGEHCEVFALRAHERCWPAAALTQVTTIKLQAWDEGPVAIDADLERVYAHNIERGNLVVGHKVATLVAAATVAEGVIISEAGVAILWRIHQVVLCTSESL
jgi:hypothetical protein